MVFSNSYGIIGKLYLSCINDKAEVKAKRLKRTSTIPYIKKFNRKQASIIMHKIGNHNLYYQGDIKRVSKESLRSLLGHCVRNVGITVLSDSIPPRFPQSDKPLPKSSGTGNR